MDGLNIEVMEYIGQGSHIRGVDMYYSSRYRIRLKGIAPMCRVLAGFCNGKILWVIGDVGQGSEIKGMDACSMT